MNEPVRTDKDAVLGHERIPRPKDVRTLRKMTNHAAYRFDSMDDLWHAAMLAHCGASYWNGVPILKNHFDMHRYYDLLVEMKPEIIVETGVQNGGSAMFFMDMLGILNMYDTPYIGIDLSVDHILPQAFEHSHSHLWIQRDCLAHETIEEVKRYIDGKKVLLILDSVHTKIHVDEELRLYAPLVTVPGSYLVVEDTDHNGHPVLADYGPAAGESVDEFMKDNKDFIRDKDIELRYGKFTVAPDAWLKRI